MRSMKEMMHSNLPSIIILLEPQINGNAANIVCHKLGGPGFKWKQRGSAVAFGHSGRATLWISWWCMFIGYSSM